MKKFPSVYALCALAAVLVIWAADAHAQIRPKSVETTPSNVRETKRRRPPVSTGPRRPVDRTGELRIGPAREGASILLNGKPAKATLDKQENQYVIDDLAAGKHVVTYDHPDFVIVERTLTVRPGNEYVWTPDLKPATAELTVATEPFTKVYVDYVQKGDTLPDGTLRIDSVRLGSHEIKLVKDGYEDYAEKAQFEYQKPVRVARKLVPLPNSAEFSDLFDLNLNKWTKPANGWTLRAGRLHIANAPTLGFPSRVNYRDLKAMAFHLKLTDGGGAAWAVRAKDPNNYYLFYLSGPNGQFPGYFNTYVVRDGKLDLTNPANSVPVIENLLPGGEYQIELKATGNVIEHSITPAATGSPIKLGVFQDPNNTFPYGGVGFRTVAAEQFSVDDLFVQPQ